MSDRHYTYGIISALVLVLLAAFALLYPSSSPAAPSVAWTPPSVTQGVQPGETVTVSAAFTAAKNLDDVVVRVVPELEPYVQADPVAFGDVSKGETRNLTLTISVPIDAQTTAFDGTVQLRKGGGSNKNYAKPLPVVINIVEGDNLIFKEFDDPNLGISFQYPSLTTSSEVKISPGENDAYVIRVSYLSLNIPNEFVPTFQFFVLPNTEQMSLSEWFLQNVDITDTLVSSGAFAHRFLPNGKEAFSFSGPLTEAHLEAYGPVASYYAISASGQSIISATLTHDHELYHHGITSMINQDSLLADMLNSMKVP